VHTANGPASSEHWNVEPASLDENVNDALVEIVVEGGPESMLVLGGVVSGGRMVHAWLAGVVSVFPDRSVARTANVWLPAIRPAYEAGDAHALYPTPSSEQANVAPDSLAENVNVAVVAVVLAGGPEPIVVSGAVVSGGTIVQACIAGVGSTPPAAPIARTLKVCAPSVSEVNVMGEEHAANGAVSSEHSNVVPASLAENVNVALVASVEAAGPESMVVSGGGG
jgi:hypothetical protein